MHGVKRLIGTSSLSQTISYTARVSFTTSRYIHLGVIRLSLTSTFPLLACGRRRCTIVTFCDQSSYNQFHFVYDWIHGFCDVVEERIFEATVWPVLLGSYEPSPHCRFKVR